MKREKELKAFERLLDIMDDLREKCPWDRKQTLESLRPNTIEETYELSDAILAHDMRSIAKELGDLLLHIVFYAKIGSETGDFDIADVCNMLCDKLIYRHPHVYGDVQAETAGQVVQNWEQLKRREKGDKRVCSYATGEAKAVKHQIENPSGISRQVQRPPQGITNIRFVLFGFHNGHKDTPISLQTDCKTIRFSLRWEPGR